MWRRDFGEGAGSGNRPRPRAAIPLGSGALGWVSGGVAVLNPRLHAEIPPGFWDGRECVLVCDAIGGGGWTLWTGWTGWTVGAGRIRGGGAREGAPMEETRSGRNSVVWDGVPEPSQIWPSPAGTGQGERWHGGKNACQCGRMVWSVPPGLGIDATKIQGFPRLAGVESRISDRRSVRNFSTSQSGHFMVRGGARAGLRLGNGLAGAAGGSKLRGRC